MEIVNFAVYEGSPDRAEAPPAGAEGETLRELEPLDLGEGASDPVHLAILLDNWNMRPEDRARVFDDLRVFLEERVMPEDRVAILVHDRSLQMVQRFTDDRQELSLALDRIERIAPSATTLPSERRQAIEQIADTYLAYFDGGGDPEVVCHLGAGWGSMENAARSYAVAVQAHTRVSAAATASAADVLTGLPGHRVLLYVGTGMPQTAGIEVFQLLSEVCPSRVSELLFFQNDFDLTWLFQEVARRVNAPDFAGDFERLAGDLRNYYSLGFHPPEPGDGELHNLEVRLEGDRSYRVRHRRAYWNKPPEQRMAERVLGVAQFGGGPNPLAVRLEIGEAIPVDGSYRVPVRLWVPLAKLTLVPGEEEGTLLTTWPWPSATAWAARPPTWSRGSPCRAPPSRRRPAPTEALLSRTARGPS